MQRFRIHTWDMPLRGFVWLPAWPCWSVSERTDGGDICMISRSDSQRRSLRSSTSPGSPERALAERGDSLHATFSDPHLGYALTWFCLAAGLAVLVGFGAYRRRRHMHDLEK